MLAARRGVRRRAVVTVLVIACPHALGLAVPLVIAISTTLGARNGLLVRDRRGLEEARSHAVVFDKTGTLTLGEHRVVGDAHGRRRSRRTTRCASPPRSSRTPSIPSRGRSSERRRARLTFRARAISAPSPAAASQATVDGRDSPTAARTARSARRRAAGRAYGTSPRRPRPRRRRDLPRRERARARRVRRRRRGPA